jgi:hypothetical protein
VKLREQRSRSGVKPCNCGVRSGVKPCECRTLAARSRSAQRQLRCEAGLARSRSDVKPCGARSGVKPCERRIRANAESVRTQNVYHNLCGCGASKARERATGSLSL